MEFIIVLLVLVAIISLCYAGYVKSKTLNINQAIQHENKILEQQNNDLKEESSNLLNSKQLLQADYDNLLITRNVINQKLKELTDQQQSIEKEIFAQTVKNEALQNQYSTLKQTIDDSMRDQKELAHSAFVLYCDILDEEYHKSENAYDELNDLLKDTYNKNQDLLVEAYQQKKEEIAADLAQCQLELDKIRSTRAAALEAQNREEKLKNERAFYSLSIDEKNERDILILEEVKSKLNDSRPLLMAMWSAYYLKPANELAVRVLGSATRTGIYKITQPELGLCYIGQARDIKERWREHLKHGLGIDTPAGNRLYRDMNKYGIESFTFELLEECSINELNEKEKYYIELYNSYDAGYNNNKGIGK